MNRNAIACFLGMSLSLAAQTLPSCPAITKSTKLAANCAGPLIVNADNVFLDLGGRTVFCTATSPWYGIEVSGRRGVRIENGNVNDCVRGLNLIGGGGHLIKKVNLRRANTHAAAIYYGIYSEGSAKNWFEGVVAEGNDVGADLTRGSYENTMKGVKLNKNALDGLQFDVDATDNEVKESEINENGRFGVYYGPRAARNVLYRNQIQKNGWLGANPDSANVLQKNVIKGNGFTSDPAAWLRGGVILFGTNNIIVENEVAENNGDGIAAGLLASEEAVANGIWTNKTARNTGYDLADYPSGLCTENDWGKNTGGTEFAKCEKSGGEPPDFHAMASGKSGGMTFQLNAQRRSSGPATGKAKITGVRDALGKATNARIEGRITCLAVHSLEPKLATVGLIIEKSSAPETIPAYSTLHVFLAEGLAADGSPADLISAGNANQFGAGECPASPPTEAISKGKVVIAVK
jgi:hypothetical protein